jgi:SAM-dependent methyltransferase
VNSAHRELCSSERWAGHVRDEILPWATDDLPLPARLLELGPGYGAATDVLRGEVGSLVAVEKDPLLAAGLRDRFASDPAVDVREGDATALVLGDDSVDGATCFTMLHHVPSTELQNRLFAEVARVVRPGGVFFGVDSLGGRSFSRLHDGDVCVPVDPLTLAERLEECGFTDVSVSVLSIGVRFRAVSR